MLFQIYGDTAGWQLLGWVMVFVGLVVMNEIARRTKAGGIFCFFVLPAALTVYFIAIYMFTYLFPQILRISKARIPFHLIHSPWHIIDPHIIVLMHAYVCVF